MMHSGLLNQASSANALNHHSQKLTHCNDHLCTCIHLQKLASWQVEVVGKEEKRGLTASVTNDMTGSMLPLQLIYQGKTDRSLPSQRASAQASGHLLS